MATPLNIEFTEDDFKEAGSYDDLKHGEEYIATLLEVDDIVASTGNTGWGFKFSVEGLNLTSRIWLSGGGKWKVREIFNALGQPIAVGTNMAFLDPNPLVGNQCVITIQKEAKQDNPEEFWTNIGRHTPLVVADATVL